MEGAQSWGSFASRVREVQERAEHLELSDFETYSDDEEGNDEQLISFDSILPDELLERILAFLPIASVFRAATVCKRWKAIAFSRKFLWQCSKMPSQKPWYYMFTNCEYPSGLAYDPVLKKWHRLKLPCIDTSGWFVVSSFGLVCFLDHASRNQLYVCNPITKEYRKLPQPSESRVSDYSALGFTVNKETKAYAVVVARSKQIPNDYLQWNLSIEVLHSGNNSWFTPVSEVLRGWRGGDEGVICNGVMYCLIYSTGMIAKSENRHGLAVYDLSDCSLQVSSISMPCLLTCGRLMNLKERLVMVGGIGKPDRPDIIKGIGIWELDKNEWQEIVRMPHKLFQGFGELDDVFSSSGTGDLIYIQSYGAPVVLVFDMNQRNWRWCQKCPVSKKFPLQLFSGFCFEPRLEVGFQP